MLDMAQSVGYNRHSGIAHNYAIVKDQRGTSITQIVRKRAFVTNVAGFWASSSVFFVSTAPVQFHSMSNPDAVIRYYIRRKLLILGSYQSGQLGLTVNQLSSTSGVRIPHCPPKKPARVAQR